MSLSKPMAPKRARWLRLIPRRRRFAGDRSGAAAVEFAMVVPVFLLMMFSTFEVGWFFYANSIVDASVADAARLVKTGQIQQLAGTQQQKFDVIYNTVCDVLDTFGACDTRLTLEVQTYTTFSDLAADATPATCADAPPADITAIPFVPGIELEIVRVRICYIYNTINPAIGINLSEPGTSKRRLISSMIFRNEPYQTTTP
jgi:Flp pilus assembly protein TadG